MGVLPTISERNTTNEDVGRYVPCKWPWKFITCLDLAVKAAGVTPLKPTLSFGGIRVC